MTHSPRQLDDLRREMEDKLSAATEIRHKLEVQKEEEVAALKAKLGTAADKHAATAEELAQTQNQLQRQVSTSQIHLEERKLESEALVEKVSTHIFGH